MTDPATGVQVGSARGGRLVRPDDDADGHGVMIARTGIVLDGLAFDMNDAELGALDERVAQQHVIELLGVALEDEAVALARIIHEPARESREAARSAS